MIPTAVHHRRAFVAAVAAAATVALTVGMTTSASAAPVTPSAVTVDVQTYNLDLGADLTPLFGVSDLPGLMAGAATVYANVQSSLPEERMQAIAKVISKQRPDMIGLQEVATWATASYVSFPFVVGPYTTTYDFLGLLLDDLAKRGTPYVAVSADVTFDSAGLPIPIPISPTTAARYIDRNVVLVSTGLQKHAYVHNSQTANYAASFSVSLLGVPLAITRGWASVDVTQRGRTFRVFDTHLEAYGQSPLKDEVRNPQAAELAGLADASPYPTIVVGDMNSRPTLCATWRHPPLFEDANTVAYGILQGAGLREVWPMVHRRTPCSPASWTSGQDSLFGPTSTLTHRIDDVFVSCGFRALQTTVVGDTAADLSVPNGLWPSDHASTVAKVGEVISGGQRICLQDGER
jgi:endonuclease/exonuclease/phosphatase family metal-dependent hydrolase